MHQTLSEVALFCGGYGEGILVCLSVSGSSCSSLAGREC